MVEIIFEDKQMERDLTEVLRTAQFRRLRRHMVDERNGGGDPEKLADALAQVFKAHLMDAASGTGS